MKLLLALTMAFATTLRADDYEPRTYTAPDGSSIPYRLLKPQNYDAAKKYPVVLFLHGAGERGSDNQSQLRHGAPLFLKPEVREKFACFVVAPQCPTGQKWADIDWSGSTATQAAEMSAPMKLVVAALDGLEKEFSIDLDRQYVTGLSMGGFGSWDLITRNPDRWAAAAPICGGGDATKAPLAKSVAIWAFHGGSDPTVPVAQTRGMIAAIKAAGGSPLYSEYPTFTHDSWTNAYQEPELLPWMFAQKHGLGIVAFSKIAPLLAQPPSNLFPSDGPIQPGVWFRGLWLQRRTEWAKSALEDQGAVVFFGDSITQGWGSLAHDFPNLKVANRGISGDTTRGLLGRIKGDVLDIHPKAVNLLIGTNDLSLGAEPGLVAENIQQIVTQIHAADAAVPVIIDKVMPRGPQAGKFPEEIRELNQLLDARLRGDAMVRFCDTFALFDDGTGSCKKDEFPDMLHPNAAGYTKWTAALEPIFDELKLEKK